MHFHCCEGQRTSVGPRSNRAADCRRREPGDRRDVPLALTPPYAVILRRARGARLRVSTVSLAAFQVRPHESCGCPILQAERRMRYSQRVSWRSTFAYPREIVLWWESWKMETEPSIRPAPSPLFVVACPQSDRSLSSSGAAASAPGCHLATIRRPAMTRTAVPGAMAVQPAASRLPMLLAVRSARVRPEPPAP